MNEEMMNNDAPDMQPEAPKPEGGIGPAAGVIIVVILLLLGGLYFFLFADKTSVIDDFEPTDEQLEDLGETSDSDEVADIEADLETDFEDIDAELNTLEDEFENI